MNVTIIADASYCSETRAGGWAAWVASNRGKCSFSGPFKTGLESSVNAEMAGVVNAVSKAIQKGYLRSGDHLYLQSDCQSILNRFRCHRGFLPAKDTEKARIMLHFSRLMAAHNLKLTVRHVKGHSQKKRSRYAAQRHCDHLAYQHMAQVRSQYRENESLAHRGMSSQGSF